MLTNAAAKAAGAQARAYKLHDQGGLLLLVRPTGTKSWQMKYRWHGREKLLTIGTYPELNVAQARMAQAKAKEQLGNGVDPSRASGSMDGARTFGQVARAWYRHNLGSWSPAHAADVLGSLERDVFPAIGERPVGAIQPPELLELLQAVEKRARLATAHRIRQRLSEIYAFAIAKGLATADPAAKLGAAMQDTPPATPHPALTDVNACRALLQACELVPARPMTRLASGFLALTAVRLEAVRGMRWGEVSDLDGKEPIWRVPAARMKLARAKKGEERFDHWVPLSPAAVATLLEARTLTFNGEAAALNPAMLVFPGRSTDQPIGEGAIRELYLRTPFAGRHVPHGWRSSFSTIMNEQLGETWRLAIDMTLAHAAKGKVEAAYNRAQLLDRRREVLERWAELLAS